MLAHRIRVLIVLAFVSASFTFWVRPQNGVSAHKSPKPRAEAPAYTLFESGQVRPLALSPDGTQLFAVNTPDGRLEVFDLGPQGPTHRASIPVGLEPAAVAARTNSEAWVVNHLSDSVSVVNVGRNEPNRVTRTLLVGDEPRDIVFAGTQKRRAFITTTHRGQNSPADPQLTTPGVGRADVWVFDSQVLGAPLGGTPLIVVTLFSDTPRALAATPDGSRVYVAAHASGNRTTTLPVAFDLNNLASITSLRLAAPPIIAECTFRAGTALAVWLVVLGLGTFVPGLVGLIAVGPHVILYVIQRLLQNTIDQVLGNARLIESPAALPPGIFDALGKLVPTTLVVDDLVAEGVLDTPTSPWSVLPISITKRPASPPPGQPD